MDSNGELSASPLHMGLASNSSVDSLFLDPNSSPPLVSGGVRMPPLIPPPPFPPLPPFPPMSPYHHPISPPLSFVPPPPPEGMYPQSVDGHRPPPLGRMSSPPPPPSPSHSPHLHHANSRQGKYASPFQDRKGERKSASPPTDMYRGMPIDDRGHMDEWGRYRTPPPHPTHLPDYPPFPYPHPRQHWEDDSMPPTSSFRPLPSQAEAVREKKGGKSKDNHPTEMENLEKANRYGGKQ
ncbi:hypothetical protein J437_LFUL004962 [Ladona fulva]|uniref:Uncharacterized protein n=1 Tax=Ladona fulva TaxID=123851 RepID=A0A8K0JW78_LADFU|nr:hypothetical protein J437_LFUL004962 [Ladona fulva]